MGSAASARRANRVGDIVRTMLEQKIMEGELQLPVLPVVVMEVVQLTHSSDSSASHLSDLIHRDQALAGHVLRIANSALYLPSVRIVSLQQAISRLGMRIIGEIAISLSVKEIAFDVRGYENEVAFLWRHAAAAGGFAREIARHLRMSVESALLCGLLQNVGKPILLRLVRDTSEQLGASIEKESLLDMVEEYHTVVGSQMAGAWGLPDVVTTTIHFHHDPASAPKYRDETRIAALADVLAAHLLATDSAALESHRSLGGPDGADPGDAVAPGESEVVESAEETADRLVRTYPDFAELGMYPEDVVQLLSLSDQIRETVETFS